MVRLDKELEKHLAEGKKSIRGFENFKKIQETTGVIEQQRLWLEDYHGLTCSKALNKKHFIKWATEPLFYNKEEFTTEINCIGRKKDRLVIEFDGEPEKAKKDFEETKERLKNLGYAYIHSSHNSSKSDYLWVEFERDLTTAEAQNFLFWIAPEGSEVDLNFTSDKKVFPVLFALHWKYSNVRELPVEFFSGEKIDYDSENIPDVKVSVKTSVGEDGFEYKTYIKNEKELKRIFGVEGQVEQLYEIQPFFYDRSGMFMIWDNEMKKYVISDEIDILNGISEIGADTISSKSRTEIVNALKQYGRKKLPETPPKTWVQFKDKIYDYATGEEFMATPDYFITNPIPHNVGDSEDTPIIDGLLKEWVGEEYSKTLEEITAYTCSSYQFMQRLIALVGGGSNGKGTYLKLLIRLLGSENTASSEIKELSQNQFETAVIYKKLLCVVGEVSSEDMKNTNQLKKLGGEDSIRYCFKGKTPFTEESPTTIIPATNSLPRTPDKTMGFYRKWLIVDFPNQFTEIKHGIIKNIPEKEFENLCRKVLRLLKELYKSQKFTKEGTFEERMNRYEERSNPVIRFLQNNYEEVMGSTIRLKSFCDSFNEYAKENHQRIMSVIQIGKLLREEGFETPKRYKDMISQVVITNLKQKTLETTNTTTVSSHFSRGKSTSTLGSSSSSKGFTHKELVKAGLLNDVP